MKQLEVGYASAKVPASWRDVPSDHLQRLRSTYQSRDPDARVRMAAVTSSQKGAAPSFGVIGIEYSPDFSADTSVREIVDQTISHAESTAERAPDVTTSRSMSCRDNHCDVQWGAASPDERITNRHRYWKAAGKLVTFGCICVSDGCEHLDTCRLPNPPSTAIPVDGENDAQ